MLALDSMNCYATDRRHTVWQAGQVLVLKIVTIERHNTSRVVQEPLDKYCGDERDDRSHVKGYDKVQVRLDCCRQRKQLGRVSWVAGSTLYRFEKV